MAVTDVLGLSNAIAETSFNGLDVAEMKLETVKCEVSPTVEQRPEENEHTTLSRKVTLHYNPGRASVMKFLHPNDYSRSKAMLEGHGNSVNMIINLTRNLLNEFYHMSQCHKSLYCAVVCFGPTMVMCNQCGKFFVGKGDRVLKLSNHIESTHCLIAQELLLDMSVRYSMLLERMRKFLEMDRSFIAAHFP